MGTAGSAANRAANGRGHAKAWPVVGGITLHHREMPRGCAFAVASAQGSVLVHGPAAISCTGGRPEAFWR